MVAPYNGKQDNAVMGNQPQVFCQPSLVIFQLYFIREICGPTSPS